MNERVTVRPNGEALRWGIVTPEGTRLVKRTKNHFVIYVPGHKYWADRMSGQSYAAAEYIVYQLDEATEHEDGSLTLKGSTIVYFDVRAPKISPK